MSVLHRIDDSPSYPNSARWFERASQLNRYAGAVAWSVREQEVVERPTPVSTEQVKTQPEGRGWVRGPIADNFGDICSYAAVSDG